MLCIANFRLRVEILSKTRRAWTCIFYKTETYLYFLFFYFFRRLMLVFSTFRGCAYENGNQTPPSTARSKKKWSRLLGARRNFFLRMRSAVAGLRQSNSYHKRGSLAQARSETKRIWAWNGGVTILSAPLFCGAFLDLGHNELRLHTKTGSYRNRFCF